MRIGFIGAGKVGTSFGRYLSDNNYDVVGYFSKSRSSSEKAAFFVGGCCFESLQLLLGSADIVIVTTPDDVLAHIAQEILSCELKKGQIFLHMSGALSSEVFSGLRHKGCHAASLHPLQTFADIERALKDLKDTVFTLEGDPSAIEALADILTKCGNKVTLIHAEGKALYHSAACVASNYLVTLLSISKRLMEAAGLEGGMSIAALMPLIHASIANFNVLGGEEAITGPIARGDINTIIKQLDAINKYCPELEDIYSALGKETLKLASSKKLRDQVAIERINSLWRDSDE